MPLLILLALCVLVIGIAMLPPLRDADFMQTAPEIARMASEPERDGPTSDSFAPTVRLERAAHARG